MLSVELYFVLCFQVNSILLVMDAASQPPAQHEDSHIQIEQESDFDGACTRNLQALEQLPTTMDDMAMMLPMPPSPYITHGHQPRIAHQPSTCSAITNQESSMNVSCRLHSLKQNFMRCTLGLSCGFRFGSSYVTWFIVVSATGPLNKI